MSPKGAVVIDNDRCKGCGLCIEVCPQKVLAFTEEVNSKGYKFAKAINHSACTGCVNCGIICPDGVITVYRVKN
jgi:2-oxoglutarate ferredoxin oxidoreductase subunit delta